MKVPLSIIIHGKYYKVNSEGFLPFHAQARDRAYRQTQTPVYNIDWGSLTLLSVRSPALLYPYKMQKRSKTIYTPPSEERVAIPEMSSKGILSPSSARRRLTTSKAVTVPVRVK